MIPYGYRRSKLLGLSYQEIDRRSGVQKQPQIHNRETPKSCLSFVKELSLEGDATEVETQEQTGMGVAQDYCRLKIVRGVMESFPAIFGQLT